MIRDLVLVGPNLPEAYKGVTYADYDPDRGDPAIIRKLKQWEPSPSRPNLLLDGLPGLAKTMLACATLNEYQAPVRTKQENFSSEEKYASALEYYRQKRRPAYFTQLSDLTEMQIRMFRLQGAAKQDDGFLCEVLEMDQLFEDLKNRVKMLVIDDVGKEHHTASGFAEDSFDLLVRSRWNRGLSTIFTSNVPLEEWSEQYSDSMRNFIERTSLVLEFR